jgi:hypothetical protein
VAINDHHQKATLTVALLTRVVMVGAQMEGKDHQQELMVVEAKAVITFLMEAEHHHHQEVATVVATTVATTVVIMVAEVTVVAPLGEVLHGMKQISASSITRAMDVIVSAIEQVNTTLIVHLITTEDTTMHSKVMDKLTTILHLDTTMDHPVVKLPMDRPMVDSTHMLLHLLHLLSDLLLRIVKGGTPAITNGLALMAMSKRWGGQWTVVLFSPH